VPSQEKSKSWDHISAINLSLEYLKAKKLNFHLLFQTKLFFSDPEAFAKHLGEMELNLQNELLKSYRVSQFTNAQLREIDGKNQIAIFEVNNRTEKHSFDLLHTPAEFEAPELVRRITEGSDKIEVDSKSLQIKGNQNAWALGECINVNVPSNCDTIAEQAQVISHNILSQVLYQGRLREREYTPQWNHQVYLGNRNLVSTEEEAGALKNTLNYFSQLYLHPIKRHMPL